MISTFASCHGVDTLEKNLCESINSWIADVSDVDAALTKSEDKQNACSKNWFGSDAFTQKLSCTLIFKCIKFLMMSMHWGFEPNSEVVND